MPTRSCGGQLYIIYELLQRQEKIMDVYQCEAENIKTLETRYSGKDIMFKLSIGRKNKQY